MGKKEKDSLQRKVKSRGIAADGVGDYKRHVLVCTGPQCCSAAAGQETMRYLQKRLAQLGKEGRYIYRSRVECLSFCRGGPLLVVYPEGVWYSGVTPEVCERIIQEHLLNGHIVQEFAIARNPLLPPMPEKDND